MLPYPAAAALPWEWVCAGGTLGGFLNAALSGSFSLLPSWSRTDPNGTLGPVTRLGLLVNATIGALASAGLLLALRGMLDFDEMLDGVSLRLLAWSLFVGFFTTRGLTSEVDKVLLRRAARNAAAAPAAHPDVADAFDRAPAHAVYLMAVNLLPRRRSCPPGRVDLRPPLVKVHPQRL